MNRTILFVTPNLFPLGDTGQLEIWAGLLAEAGWKVVVGVMHGQPQVDYQIRFPDIELRWWQLRGREWSGWRDVEQSVQQLNPDVLHLWNCSQMVNRLSRGLSGAVLETCFSPVAERAGTWWSRRYRKPDLRLLYDPQSLPESEEAAADGEVTAIAVSSASAVATQERFTTSRIRLIHKAPMPRHESRELTRQRLCDELALPPETKFAVAAAGFNPDTHCKDLIWGIDQLKIIRDDTHLVLLGRGPQRNRLERFLSLTEAESHTHFLGERADGPEIVAAADLFWQADLTRFQPDGLLVALACGVPTVAAYGAATSDLVLPQQTAWVARPNARYEYARWSKFFLEEVARAEQLSGQARRFIAERFPLARVEQEVREIYQPFV